MLPYFTLIHYMFACGSVQFGGVGKHMAKVFLTGLRGDTTADA